jgi:SAM-dependent methyltransferase
MDAQYAAAYSDLYRRHWWWRVREDILLRKIRRILPAVSRPRILDVGCGPALFFDALEQFGHVEGIESDPAAVERSGRWRRHVFLGELNEAYKPDAPFDLILMLDVIEHVADPERLLRRAGELLTPRGCVLVTVPAFNWLWTGHDDVNHHLRRYTSMNMRRTIGRAGLVTLETGYMFQSLVVPKVLVRLREALIPGPARVPRIPPAAINSAVQTWFRAEYSVAGWLPFGGSLLAVAARSPR